MSRKTACTRPSYLFARQPAHVKVICLARHVLVHVSCLTERHTALPLVTRLFRNSLSGVRHGEVCDDNPRVPAGLVAEDVVWL